MKPQKVIVRLSLDEAKAVRYAAGFLMGVRDLSDYRQPEWDYMAARTGLRKITRAISTTRKQVK